MRVAESIVNILDAQLRPAALLRGAAPRDRSFPSRDFQMPRSFCATPRSSRPTAGALHGVPRDRYRSFERVEDAPLLLSRHHRDTRLWRDRPQAATCSPRHARRFSSGSSARCARSTPTCRARRTLGRHDRLGGLRRRLGARVAHLPGHVAGQGAPRARPPIQPAGRPAVVVASVFKHRGARPQRTPLRRSAPAAREKRASDRKPAFDARVPRR